MTAPFESVDGPLLDVRHLVVEFAGGRTRRRAVDDVCFRISRGTTLGIVGASGSGKSTLARAILGLVPSTAGSVLFEGHELTRLSARRMRPMRRFMQIVFQDSAGSLNPRMTVGQMIAEPLLIHRVGSREDRWRVVKEVLDRVRLPRSSEHRYAHDFSGGQRQRINIARAVSLRPKLLVCDEPVSALDVSVQAQILNLLRELQRDLGLTLLFISHNLAVVKYMSDQVAVMHHGRIVENGAVEQVFADPRHEYTRHLLESGEPSCQSVV